MTALKHISTKEDIVESRCDYCGETDKQRCLSVPEARACSRKPAGERIKIKALLDKSELARITAVQQLKHLAHPLSECMSDKVRLDLMIKLIGEL